MKTREELVEALDRADKLINWLAVAMKHIAPGSYSNCYSDLNDHYLFMIELEREKPGEVK